VAARTVHFGQALAIGDIHWRRNKRSQLIARPDRRGLCRRAGAMAPDRCGSEGREY
jgi:hypothetical protein